MSPLILQFLYVVLFGISLGTITYHQAALERGWSSMTSFENPKSPLMITAFVGIVASVVLTAYFLAWWQVVVTAIAGYVVMVVFLGVFRQGFWLVAFFLFLITPYAIAIARPN